MPSKAQTQLGQRQRLRLFSPDIHPREHKLILLNLRPQTSTPSARELLEVKQDSSSEQTSQHGDVLGNARTRVNGNGYPDIMTLLR